VSNFAQDDVRFWIVGRRQRRNTGILHYVQDDDVVVRDDDVWYRVTAFWFRMATFFRLVKKSGSKGKAIAKARERDFGAD
jgi:hypothetical protein